MPLACEGHIPLALRSFPVSCRTCTLLVTELSDTSRKPSNLISGVSACCFGFAHAAGNLCCYRTYNHAFWVPNSKFEKFNKSCDMFACAFRCSYVRNMTAQIRRFLGPFARWLCTVVVTALVFTTAQIYHAKGNFTSAHKAAFHTVMVSLTLLLGLNFYVSPRYAVTVQGMLANTSN